MPSPRRPLPPFDHTPPRAANARRLPSAFAWTIVNAKLGGSEPVALHSVRAAHFNNNAEDRFTLLLLLHSNKSNLLAPLTLLISYRSKAYSCSKSTHVKSYAESDKPSSVTSKAGSGNHRSRKNETLRADQTESVSRSQENRPYIRLAELRHRNVGDKRTFGIRGLINSQ